MQSSLPISENPEMYMDNSATYSAVIRKNDRFSNKRTLYEECRNILRKSHQNRFPAENQTLLRLLEKAEFLRQASESISLDFVKGLLRNAKIEFVDERQVIVQEEQPLNYMVVVLEGKLGVQKSSQPFSEAEAKESNETVSIKTPELLERLTLVAKKERDQLRRTAKFTRKSIVPSSEYEFYPPVLSDNDYRVACMNVDRNILVNQDFGGRERLVGTNYRSRVFALEKSTLLVLQMNFVYYWLESAYKAKLARSIEQMKTIPAFQTLQQQKLCEIILSMKLMRRKKNDLLYQQGEPAELLYVLIEGQIKLTKQADLFRENPNDFYVDRRELLKNVNREARAVQARNGKKREEEVLPFANLTQLYNYRPVKKEIDIAVLSSFGLLGEEELIYHTPRETTAQIASLEASYYQIDFKKVLEILGPKNVDKFRQTLENSVSKKILYRQHEFAEHIEFENRANLNYFYLEGEHSSKPPRRLRLDRINETMAPRSARDSRSHAPAFYTTFNFNKMLTSRRYPTTKKDSLRKTTHESSSETIVEVHMDEQQEKLVGISHSWNPIQRKVRQQKMVSRKISPFKHQINIQQPLIDQQFFRDVAKQQRRINKQFRTVRLSLGKKK